MDSILVQRTRYQLQTRVRWAKTCPIPLFPNACRHMLEWFESSQILSGLLAPVSADAGMFTERLAAVLKERPKSIDGPWGTTTRENATALALAALRCVTNLDLTEVRSIEAFYIAYVLSAEHDGHNTKSADMVESIRDVAVQALYDYLDEQIDGRNAVLGLLLKYKTRCEMYRRHRLRDAATNDLEGRRGERALAFDMYEYLHDQGVDFSIEAVSASGEPDVVSPDAGGQKLVADAKYIDGTSDARRVVARGFRQVLDYCRDHNEPAGYLVVFINRDLVLDLKGERDDGFPCFRTGGYTVYYVIIDIHEHSTTASKRPKPPVLEITYDQLVEGIANAADAAPVDEQAG